MRDRLNLAFVLLFVGVITAGTLLTIYQSHTHQEKIRSDIQQQLSAIHSSLKAHVLSYVSDLTFVAGEDNQLVDGSTLSLISLKIVKEEDEKDFITPLSTAFTATFSDLEGRHYTSRFKTTIEKHHVYLAQMSFEPADSR